METIEIRANILNRIDSLKLDTKYIFPYVPAKPLIQEHNRRLYDFF